MSVWDLPLSMHLTLYFIHHSYFIYLISTSRCSLLSEMNKPGCRLCPWKNNGFPLSGHRIDVTCSQPFSLRLTLLHRHSLLALSNHLLPASTSCSQHPFLASAFLAHGFCSNPWCEPRPVERTNFGVHHSSSERPIDSSRPWLVRESVSLLSYPALSAVDRISYVLSLRHS